ncbi:hypothetical protein TA3x_000249 [Tundrisphaera sp. TA3]|uniref:hypothetical protein n=1 Tax=Tundrisphaera sp. TA3 TaxID=3435775 RepID=UPI003EBAF1BC
MLCTGEFSGYDDLSRFGKHMPTDRGEVFADGPAHINGIEGFWSYAKRLHRLCHGADREKSPVYLAEYEFRCHHREEHPPGVLYRAPILPQLIRDGLAWDFVHCPGEIPPAGDFVHRIGTCLGYSHRPA